jgi:hypothetical protein
MQRLPFGLGTVSPGNFNLIIHVLLTAFENGPECDRKRQSLPDTMHVNSQKDIPAIGHNPHLFSRLRILFSGDTASKNPFRVIRHIWGAISRELR